MNLPTFGWRRLARNPNASPAELRALAVRGNVGVRAAVAQNPRAPKDILGMLGESSEAAIRKALAINPATPVAVLVNLANGSDTAVRSAALGHPSLVKNYSRFCDAARGRDFSTPETASEALAALLHDGGQSTIKFITSNYMRKHWPRRDVLDVLAHSPHASIRSAVGKHENVGESALALLAGCVP